MKLHELKQIIREEIEKELTTQQSMPSIQINKYEYDKLKSNNKVLISRISRGFNHKPSPQMYKRYPKGTYEIIVKNPHNKRNEVFMAKTNHDDSAIYILLTPLD
jgi:hypothetical protein